MARSSALYRTRGSYGGDEQGQGTRSKYKFPVLDVGELVELYATMQFGISERDLLRPTQTFVMALIEQIMDKFLYISPHSLRQRVVSRDEEVGPSLNIVMCQRIMYKFLCDCGVDDFSIRDIAKPEAARVRIILSSLVNYARFREQRMLDCADLLDSNYDVLEEYRNLAEVNSQYKTQIDDLEHNLQAQSPSLSALNEKNKQLEAKLMALKTTQEEITAHHHAYREEKQTLVKELENQSALYIESEKDLEQIRPYIKESPESIKELVGKMEQSKQREREIVQELEARSRDLPVSEHSFDELIREFSSLNSLVEELVAESNKHKALVASLQTIRKDLAESNEELADLVRRTSQVEGQLKHNEERLAKLKAFYNDKMEALDMRLGELMTELNELKARRNAKDVETLEKEVQIATWQRQILTLDSTWEAECKEGAFTIEKLNAQVQVYLEEMKKRMGEVVFN